MGRVTIQFIIHTVTLMRMKMGAINNYTGTKCVNWDFLRQSEMNSECGDGLSVKMPGGELPHNRTSSFHWNGVRSMASATYWNNIMKLQKLNGFSERIKVFHG